VLAIEHALLEVVTATPEAAKALVALVVAVLAMP
jgi:hypothetical protein